MAKCELQVWDVLSLSTSVGLKGFLTRSALRPEGSRWVEAGEKEPSLVILYNSHAMVPSVVQG